MTTVLRFLGVLLLVRAAARLALRLPRGLAPVVTGAVLVLTNLLPVWAVATGRVGMGDVFLVYWIENVVVWACWTVRVATAQGGGGEATTRQRGRGEAREQARFFALHYGIFTLVHGIFAVIIAAIVGLVGGLVQVAVLALLIAASHVFSLGVHWFGRQERLVVTSQAAMVAPYPRMLVLHVGILVGFGVALDGLTGGSAADQVGAVALLCGLKTAADLAFHLWQHRPRAQRADGLYGAPVAETVE